MTISKVIDFKGGSENVIVWACKLKDNLISVQAHWNTHLSPIRNSFEEKIYKTNNENGALNYYIKDIEEHWNGTWN